MMWNHPFSFIIRLYHLDAHDGHRIFKKGTFFLLWSFSREQASHRLLRWWPGDETSQAGTWPQVYVNWDQVVGEGDELGLLWGDSCQRAEHPSFWVGQKRWFLPAWSQVKGLWWDAWGPLAPSSAIWGAGIWVMHVKPLSRGCFGWELWALCLPRFIEPSSNPPVTVLETRLWRGWLRLSGVMSAEPRSQRTGAFTGRGSSLSPPSEDTVRRRQPAGWEEGSPQNPTVMASLSRTYSLQNREK